jgi:alpha-beta hydrolase superfamily lysophospholipase
MDVQRTPCYFGEDGRTLFGWNHLPQNAATIGAAVVCPPLGHEYMSSHRTLRHLADRLAASGIAVLRFDYEGTGNSGGEESDPHQFPRWIASVRDAAAELRRRSGHVAALVGLRMGATIAACAAREIDCESLVLWAPCVRGRTFVRELKALAQGANPSSDSGRGFEAVGFTVSGELQQDLGSIDLAAVTPRTRRVLVAGRDDVPESMRAFVRWSEAGIEVDSEVLPGYPEMMVAPHHTKVPLAAIDFIAGWLATGGSSPASVGSDDARPAHSPGDVQSMTLGDLRESVLRFGDDRGGFGVLTQTAAASRTDTPAVILSNAGTAHNVGPNRLYVHLARALATEGFPCLRLDLPGLGDSAPDDAGRENIAYPPEATRAIGDAADALVREIGPRPLVVAGLCSGAHTAFHAARELADHAIVEAVLFNPLTFDYQPGMPLDAPSDPHVSRWQRYRRSIGSARGWSKLFQGKIAWTTIAADVLERIAHAARAAWLAVRVHVLRVPDPREQTTLAVRIRGLAARNRRITLVFSEFDPGHDLLMREAGIVVRQLQKQGLMTFWTITGANHTFDARDARGRMIQSVVAWLGGRYLKVRSPSQKLGV